MATEIPANERSRVAAHPAAGPYLAPIEKPKGLMLRLLYWLMRRQFGKTPSWLTVFGARMPLAFTNWGGKAYRLGKKLKLSHDTETLIRARVSGINMCTWCMDAERWFVRPRRRTSSPSSTRPATTAPALCSATRSARRSTSRPS
jgi:hypothetical protein